MKRYIRCTDIAKVTEYPINIKSVYPEVDEIDLSTDIRNILEPAAEYVSAVEVNLGTLSINDIRVYSIYNIAQLRVTCPTKNIYRCIDKLLDNLEHSLSEFVARNKQKETAKTSGKSLQTAHAMISRLIKKQFGLTPTFTYSDTGTLLYYLWDLPFTQDQRHNTVIQLDKAGEQYAREFENFLEDAENKYDLKYMEYHVPLAGGLRSSWNITIPPKYNSKYTYDKNIHDYVKADF